ncbi:hypothetical protein [Streptomyces subrutilus]|uniref:Uncharacterized protein n=1 Tax=Streptomyces subrutilus TaxID=36818 RepID=A0A1E5PMI4_9ACTN|nr:hypothetical protein [Streptomyces subrutilus]OEJ30767.1 hypothetical protein BGK67_04895 [Streptomyces subrutilus]
MTYSEGVADFHPTHVVPQEGLPAWETPDASRPTVPLDAFLPVQLLTRRGDWGEVLCANGWSAWVDGRLLVSVPQPPPTAGGRPPGRAEDPGPQLERGVAALERYRRAVAELAAGRTDSEAFRRSVRGLRAGIVIDGESVWLYDESAGRWLYGDGTRMMTYAAVAGPGAPLAPGTPPAPASPPAEPSAPAPVSVQPDVEPDPEVGHAPTRIVDRPGHGGE